MALDAALFLLIGFLYVAGVVFVANREEMSGDKTMLLSILLYIVIGLMAVSALNMMQLVLLEVENVNVAEAILAFAFNIFAAVVSYQVVSAENELAVLRQATGPTSLYNPASSVHKAAVVLALGLLSVLISSFAAQGGLTGLAEQLEQNQSSPFEPVLMAVFEVAIAFLGVGLGLRRTMLDSLQRLGLRIPTRQDVIWGIGIGIALFGAAYVFGFIWTMFQSEQSINEQTQASQQLANSFATLPMALIASLSAAFGEEILVRGAIQPVFGIALSSVFFALLHTQHLLTPALLLILIVSLGLGWLRVRYSTTSAIIAHFTYDFIQLALLVFITSTGG